jgi:hypothetical protein
MRSALLDYDEHFSQSDLNFVCVGTWIEGFHTYFVTRIVSPTPVQPSHLINQYACFVSENGELCVRVLCSFQHFLTKQKDIASNYLLSMATDDSCRDLNSKYMATVMTLAPMMSRHLTWATRYETMPDNLQF